MLTLYILEQIVNILITCYLRSGYFNILYLELNWSLDIDIRFHLIAIGRMTNNADKYFRLCRKNGYALLAISDQNYILADSFVFVIEQN